MADQDKKEELEAQKEKIPAGERAIHFKQEGEKIPERKEALRDEKIISEELRREIELMEVDDNLKKQAEQKANKIQFLADDDKLKKLLEVAREKGIIFAVQVAKKMNEPYLLDTLHDILAKEGYYKDFTKKIP